MTPPRQRSSAPLSARWRAALVLWFCWLNSPVWALSLGQESILSALGDPIEVEIDVLQWDDVDLARVEIALASRAEYEAFNLVWLPALEQLDFNLVGPNMRGEVKVLVSTREPVVEPYVELLLVLRWPGGSLLREYVLLFDLPELRSANTAVLAERLTALEPVVVPEPAEPTGPVVIPEPAEPTGPVVIPEPAEPTGPVVISEPAAPTGPVVISEPAAQEALNDAGNDLVQGMPEPRSQGVIVVESTAGTPTPLPPASGRRIYQVREGDGLWSIAQQFKPAGVGDNIYQMLLSLHDLNRAAFINGNISLLKANALLQIPDAADIEAVAADRAESLFEQRWDEGTVRLQTALRGEPLPAFSDLYESERSEPGPEAQQQARVPGQETGRLSARSDSLLLPAETPVVVLQSGVDSSAAGLLLDEPGLQVNQPQATADASRISADTRSAAGPAVATVNPYLERIDETARDLQALLQNRSLQIARLEEQLQEMRLRMRDAQQLTTRLNEALEQALARQADQRQRPLAGTSALGRVTLVLLAALVMALVLLLRLTAQLRSQRRSLAADALPGPAFEEAPSIIVASMHGSQAHQLQPSAEGIVVHEEPGMPPTFPASSHDHKDDGV